MLNRVRGTIVVVPAVAWLAIFFLLPLAFIAVVSLGSRDELGRIVLDDLSFDNYGRAFNPDYLPTLINALRYATLTTLCSLAIGYPIAYWISRYGGRRKVLLLLLVMLPFWTSWLIRTYAWMIILRDNGVVNAFLQAIGLTNEPIILLNTDFAVVLGMTYGFLPFAILPIYVAIDRLDQNLVSAARDLYASGRSAFLHVTLPLSMPGIIAASLLTKRPARHRSRPSSSRPPSRPKPWSAQTDKLVYLTQTTLSVDDTDEIVRVLRRRFPAVEAPKKDDICYATTNRQRAVKRIVAAVDLLLVIGSRNSSNSNRLVDVARAGGVVAYLIDDESEIDEAWLDGVESVGLTSGASAPESLVRRVVGWFRERGVSQVESLDGAFEDVFFKLPREVRADGVTRT